MTQGAFSRAGPIVFWSLVTVELACVESRWPREIQERQVEIGRNARAQR